MIAILLGFSLAGIHVLGERLEEYISGYRERIVSFSTGASVTYIFVQLLPEFHRITLEASEAIFIAPLLGFSAIHLAEKYIAKSDLSSDEMRHEYAEVHSAFLFIYHGAIGYLVASLLAESTVSGLLFFLPIAMHTAVSSLSTSELHREFAENNWIKSLLAIAPLIGVKLHIYGVLSEGLFNPIFGTAIGMFFYVVIRDSIPEGEKGMPLEYILGAGAYLTVILAANTL